MKTKKQKTKMHRVSMSDNEMCFALFAFRKVIAHDDFLSIRIRLTNTLGIMGVDAGSEEFNEFTKRYEKLFSKTMVGPCETK